MVIRIRDNLCGNRYPQFIRDYFPSLETNNRFQHLVSPVEDLPRVFHSLFSVDLISIIWYSVSFAISVTITAITILHFLICLQQGIPMLRRFFFMSPKPRHAWRNLGTLDIEKERVANQYWIDILNTWADKLKDFPVSFSRIMTDDVRRSILGRSYQRRNIWRMSPKFHRARNRRRKRNVRRRKWPAQFARSWMPLWRVFSSFGSK